ncbi:pyridoxal phosphate-dependent decarboxylase family protein [Streptomyces sp. NPDC021100]|uniref:pyridoxal phosphate-dependent decarboxylase family protein n=1 Tax=Streptomyces sp. NPDC021100 TaxID=3365114 RepID=UPI0037BA1A38
MNLHRATPLDPDQGTMVEMADLVTRRIAGFLATLDVRPTHVGTAPEAEEELTASFLSGPPESGAPLESLMDRLGAAAGNAIESAGPRLMAAAPGGGLYSSALAEFYTKALNRYGTLAAASPALTALEEGVLRWMARDVCGLPPGGSGVLTTGGSMANLSALVTARHDRLGEDIGRGTVYVGEQAHYSVAKAARIAGIPGRHVRVIPVDGDLRMDLDAAAELIRADRAAGLRPFLLVATAGTTDTGAIDPLTDAGGLAAREDLWFHVDAAYGGFFRLTARGRERTAGLERADSVALDPHKALFLPFGTGALVVRDPARLHAAHEGTAPALQDVGASDALPDYAQRGIELSRENRGVRVWLPLHLHGLSAFRAALDEKLDLAARLHRRLSADPRLDVPWEPELTTVAFAVRPGDAGEAARQDAEAATCRLLDRINADGRAMVHSTTVGGRRLIRVCVLAHRTHGEHVDEVLDAITAGTAGL